MEVMEMAKEYLVAVSGCNDETVTIIQFNDAEVAIAKEIANRINEASTYCCQPRMRVREATEANKRRFKNE